MGEPRPTISVVRGDEPFVVFAVQPPGPPMFKSNLPSLVAILEFLDEQIVRAHEDNVVVLRALRATVERTGARRAAAN